jgi:two-component system, NarL family, nitrate/nitrite response regulator NarL
LRIVIAATHRVFASALGSLLRRAGHDVVGYAVALDAVTDIITREQADACVVDAEMPADPGALSLAMAVSEGTAFVVLADNAASAGLSRALSAGAHGAVLKSDDFLELLRVLTAARARARAGRRPSGGAVLSLSAVSARRTIRAGRRDQLVFSLTPREREVLARLVRGESTSAMARSMGVRLSTTRTHIDSVLIKLGVHSRLEAIAYAVREGIVDVADSVPAATEQKTGQKTEQKVLAGDANQATHRR